MMQLAGPDTWATSPEAVKAACTLVHWAVLAHPIDLTDLARPPPAVPNGKGDEMKAGPSISLGVGAAANCASTVCSGHLKLGTEAHSPLVCWRAPQGWWPR